MGDGTHATSRKFHGLRCRGRCDGAHHARWRFTDDGPGYSGIEGDGREVGGFALEASLDAVRAAGGSVAKEPFTFLLVRGDVDVSTTRAGDPSTPGH